METKEREGVRRVQVALRDNAKPCGWVTAAREGEQLLEIEGGGAIKQKEEPAADQQQSKGAKAKAAERKGAEPETIHYTIPELHALAELQVKTADDMEANLKAEASSLTALLGDALRQQSSTIAECIGSWDLGEITKVTKFEFRRSVRSLIKTMGTESSSEIDLLYDSLDAAKVGHVEVPLLRVALTQLRSESKRRVTTTEQVQQRIAKLRQHAEQTRAAATASAAAEAAEQALAVLREKPKVDARLGIWLAKKNVAVSDMVTMWDEDKDGLLAMKELVTRIKQLGVEASHDELDSLFSQSSDTQSGSVEVQEVVRLLKALQDSKSGVQDDEKTAMKRAAELRKVARQQIIAAHRDYEADESERAEVDEEMAAKEATKEAAKAEAKAAARAARKERDAKQKQQQQAFEAKIADKRRQSVAAAESAAGHGRALA